MHNILKKVSVLTTAMSLSAGSAIVYGQSCRHGLSWVISQNPSWGFGHPVVTRVLPYSSAEESGFKTGDIIERIDGYSTDRLTPEQIVMLLSSSNQLHTIQISNINAIHKRRILSYHCKPSNGLAERELAELFSLYSTEDASLEYVTYPYNYTYSPSYNLLNIQNYAFAKPTYKGEESLNILIDKALRSKGLNSTSSSDIIVSTNYRIDTLRDSDTVEGAQAEVYGLSWRYDDNDKELKPYPIYSQTQRGVEFAQYMITLELRLQNKLTREILWRCEAKDYLSEYMSVEDYAEQAIPTMLIGFPFAMQVNAPRLALRSLRYNYTGIVYDKNNLGLVVDVEDTSPAMKAGLHPGDNIRSINGLPLDKTNTSDYLAQYFRTAERLDRYRDKALPPLKSLVSNLSVPYWNMADYDNIASVLGQAKWGAAFSYLFGFRAYTPAKEGKAIIYEIQRGGETYYVPIIPERRNESCAYPY